MHTSISLQLKYITSNNTGWTAADMKSQLETSLMLKSYCFSVNQKEQSVGENSQPRVSHMRSWVHL